MSSRLYPSRSFEKSSNLCHGTEAQREVFPYKNSIVKFTNIKKQLKAPFVVYADAETILKPVDTPDDTGVTRREYGEKRNKDDIPTKTYQEHVPYSFCYKNVSNISTYESKIVLIAGENIIQRFIEAFNMKLIKYLKIIFLILYVNQLWMNSLMRKGITL